MSPLSCYFRLTYLNNWLIFFHLPRRTKPWCISKFQQYFWVIIDYDPNIGHSSTFELFDQVTLFQGTHSSHSLETVLFLNFSSKAPHYFDWPVPLAHFLSESLNRSFSKELEYTTLVFYYIHFFLENRWILKSLLCQLSHSNLSCLTILLSVISRTHLATI